METYKLSMSPQISVVIPVYNRGSLIEKTVASVLAQDIKPHEFEIIIVDDGSTDRTPQILDELYGDHPQIRLFHIENGGVAKARNFGLKQARGEFLAFLDHDDLWMPEKLRLQREKMEAHPHVGVVYCNWLAVDEKGEAMPLIFQHSQQSWWKPKEGEAYPWVLMPHPLEFLRNPILSMSYPLIRTQLLRDINGFDVEMVPSDDWDLWIRLSKITHFVFVPQVLAHYVHHDNQQHNDLKKAYFSWLALCRKHQVNVLKHPYVWLKQRVFVRLCHAFLLYLEAEEALGRGDKLSMIICALKSAWLRPDTMIYSRWRRLFMRAFKSRAGEATA
jgi:glycosyltransferase involved in cell wall biosynthesis